MTLKLVNGKFRIQHPKPDMEFTARTEVSHTINGSILSGCRSFDLFDTIIARKRITPDSIFDIIEPEFPFVNFKHYRIRAGNMTAGTIYDIYNTFKELTQCTDDIISKLIRFEIETEINNCYLIRPNYNQVSDGDIIVSDMYLTEDILRRLLKAVGFNKQVDIYVCRDGKITGNIWKIINKQLAYHMGDNLLTDVQIPRNYNISTQLTTIHQINRTEQFFIEQGHASLAFKLRQFRHQNPYTIDTLEYKLYNDQAIVNIPFLILLSNTLHNILRNEGLTTLLLTARDSCLLELIFPFIYPQYNTVRFEASRKVYAYPNEEYKAYLKNVYNDKCLIFDLDGAFHSGRSLFKTLFNKYPRVHLFNYYSSRDSLYDGLTFTVIDRYPTMNTYNVDIVGRMEVYPRRDPTRYNRAYANVYRNTVIEFIKFVDKKDIPTESALLVPFYDPYLKALSNFPYDQDD